MVESCINFNLISTMRNYDKLIFLYVVWPCDKFDDFKIHITTRKNVPLFCMDEQNWKNWLT